MTFYWWSHWFWITCLSVQLLSSHVHTYPSRQQEAAAAAAATQPVARQTTKLYQTTVSQTWSTATQSNIMDLTNRPTTAAAALAVTPVYAADEDEDEEQDEEDQHEDLLLNEGEEQEEKEEQEEQEEQQQADAAEVQQTVAQYEFKRSADFTSEQLNNFTNFSSSTSTNDSSSNGSSTLKPTMQLNSSSNSPVTTTTRRTTTTTTTAASTSSSASSSASSLAATTTTASTEAASTTGVAMAVAVAAAGAGAAAAATVTTPLTSSATPSTPKINTEWLSDELELEHGEKAPFTLENANKEEELRRAESEHRSRKSKVLSAEYKHINRYINFSSDTKSLLTRSASSAPSVADGYDGANEEGNISSEALAIQRTYFLDAGAISAICFTVFGICCTVGTIGIVLYRRRFLNKPQALSEPDSSVYIDDSTMRDNSDEMYSLDNDSFLNSLEAMTIQNYWTDTVKHTKL
ncbi:serine-rich adhesin for platelets isoform X2 [Drosophila obscura]|uniref:serine-rich adhesin for platelets isoform X2 n=1 Tax=Drosophila obscura TaxID=7282 RepID=UPI001BB1A5F8|nr:serine-rich adhesin for platelets isoform X2 [Drosophila obscura]